MNYNKTEPKELSRLYIDPQGNLCVVANNTELVIVGLTGNIFTVGYMVIKKEAPAPGNDSIEF